MKILTRPVIMLLAVWCIAVMFVPTVLAADQTQGTMQAPGRSGQMPGGQGSNNQMQAPPSGGQGATGPSDRQGFENTSRIRERPASDMNGNMTAPRGNDTMRGNGNITPPDFGNMTPPEMSSTSPMEFGNMTSHEMREGHVLEDNSSAPGRAPDNKSEKDLTERSAGGGLSGSEQGSNHPSGSQTSVQGQQQSLEEQINGIINQLQSLISGKK